ncbi:MMPL family transporter [Catenulispora pinisilvae]|uniref:MMPL family transporter n=1 Tax=Catenulispora pinisilvae TaxID=2705253 RepID=UPI0018912CB3
MTTQRPPSSESPAASPAASPAGTAPPRSARSTFLPFRRRRVLYLVVVLWLIVIGTTAGFSSKLSGAEKNTVEESLPSSAESTQVYKIQSLFQNPDTVPAVIVYERAGGLTAQDRAKARADAKQYATLTDLSGQVFGPQFSTDGQAAQTVIPLNLGQNYLTKAKGAVSALHGIAANQAPPGLAIHVAGPAGYSADLSKAVGGIDGTLLYSTLVVVIAILLLTYRSPVLWLFPIICAGIALTVAQGIIYLLAAHAGLTVSSDGAGILTILVFGATTDYSLLLIARYREELRNHDSRVEAMSVALRRSGPAVIASAATVAISMLCLSFADMNATRGLGPVFAVGIAVGALVMLTLFPLLMVLCGRWIFWPSVPRVGDGEHANVGRWAAVGDRIARRPRLAWIGTALILAVGAIGIGQLHSGGLSVAQEFTATQDSVVGNAAVARHFDAAVASPLVITARAGGADQVHQALQTVPGIAPGSVTAPVLKNGYAYQEATLTGAPDSSAAYVTVRNARTAVHAVAGADAKVGGDSAMNLDARSASEHDRELIAPIVLAVVLAILILLLRALVSPLLLIGTVVLSCATTLGVSALVFRHVFHFGAEDNSFPLYVFVFLIALGIDYNIFLMTRIREEAHNAGTRPATLRGLASTGGVITSAGIVLAGTFAVLGTLPLTQFAELGFAVAFGVLIDTVIVRSVMVTALNLDIGRRIWWPSALWRKPDATEATPVRDAETPARS